MKQKTPSAVLLFCMFFAIGAQAWDKVIDFDEFEIGQYRSPDDPIAELWKVTRDEGYEAGLTIGFATHHIIDNGIGGRMYSLTTAGFGFNWGHVFAAMDFDEPLTDKGTWYFQVVWEGHSQDVNISSREVPVERVEPPLETNPWGWDGPRAWGAKISTVRMGRDTEPIVIRDASAFRNAQIDWIPGFWYEVWVLESVSDKTYSVYVRSEEAGIPEPTAIVVLSGETLSDYYHYRSSAEELTGLLIGMQIGHANDPMLGHRAYFNAFAFDHNAHNLTRPPGVPHPGQVEFPVDPVAPEDPVIPLILYGFRRVEGIPGEWMRLNTFGMFGPDVWFEHAPYLYDFDLDVWLWVPDLWIPAVVDPGTGEETEPGRPHDPETSNFSARTPGWVYIWDSPFEVNKWTGVAEWGTWVWAHEGGWTWIENSRNEITHGMELTLEMTGLLDPSVLVPSGAVASAYHGQIIENLDIQYYDSLSTPALHITHNNVTVRNCRILHDGPATGIEIASSASGTFIEYCQINGGFPMYGTGRTDGNRGNVGAMVRGAPTTIRRCHFLGMRGLQFRSDGGVIFIENWLDTPHINAPGVSTAILSYRGSMMADPPWTVIARNRGVSGTSGGLMIYPVLGPARNVRIEDNLIEGVGRGFGILGGRDAVEGNRNWCYNRNIRIEGNRFTGTFGWPIALGKSTNAAIDLEVPGNTWINNRWVGSNEDLPARCGKFRDDCDDLDCLPNDPTR